MNREEEQFFNEQNSRQRFLQMQNEASQVERGQQAMWMQEQERSMVKEQLDLSEELEMIEHLLRGHILKKDSNGVVEWEAPKDKNLIILSDYGIHLIMNTITFYINKNTLLSNYDEATIYTKMEDFAEALADTVFMEYEKVFEYPTDAYCQELLLDRLDKKTKNRLRDLELQGLERDYDTLYKNFVSEIDPEKERKKIKEQIIKNKLKRFLILIREVQDAVHSTYLRALAGQERKTLREHVHISETKGMNYVPQKTGGFSPLGWLKRN